MDVDIRRMSPIQHAGDWDPVHQEDPTRPAWDQEALTDNSGLRSANVSQDNFATGQPLLTLPHLSNRDSVALDMTGDKSYRNSIASQRQYDIFLERANRQLA
ncbi:hypothetical protein BDM02DRAFT_3117476, partial [Thelephora ganbajun]